MRNVLGCRLSWAILLVVVGFGFGQFPGTAVAASGAQASDTAASSLRPGTVIEADLDKGLNAKKAKQGDPVIAKATVDVKHDNAVLIPAGSKLIGHVTEVKAHSKEQPQSSLGIVFDRVELKHGQQLPLHAVIQAVGSAQPAGTSMQGPDMAPAMGGNRPMGGQSPMGRGSSGMPQMENPGGVAGQEGQTPAAGGQNSSGASPVGGLAGINAKGELTANARGVVGIPDLTLSNSAQGAVLNSKDNNVRLDGGTQFLLVSQ